ncbi:uncharacterized protein LACBIDRAFT_323288 [Laccaria bicolor S238N-H82]|uniref:Predicted protein n=1 Tax=Laccaria bicolor (strain S238N-H82 / ATCC MYA-4686) TaxID=486041 RepID=B0CZQ8_LACBS|nr:uncharacterized protein LACBIDRAFT_323288 [Laccaria bicolor S238N-H82]EDR12660.1 predicted protein [Laccaria bicolor S238N-H82]|eukprot:XP_001876924.1 predicted protein [Laccaria bicolor S238N-H82]
MQVKGPKWDWGWPLNQRINMHPPEARSRIHREQQPGVFSALVAQIPQAVQWAHLSSSKLDFQFVAPKDLVVIYPPVRLFATCFLVKFLFIAIIRVVVGNVDGKTSKSIRHLPAWQVDAEACFGSVSCHPVFNFLFRQPAKLACQFMQKTSKTYFEGIFWLLSSKRAQERTYAIINVEHNRSISFNKEGECCSASEVDYGCIISFLANKKWLIQGLLDVFTDIGPYYQ